MGCRYQRAGSYGEATGKLLKYDLLDEEYKRVVDFRNHIVHGYFGIDEEIVWEVVNGLLDKYITDLYQVIDLKKLDLKSAIQRAKEDYHYSPPTVAFLDELTEK